MIIRAGTVGALLTVVVFGCSPRRRPLGRTDAGPAVVVVQPRPPAHPQVELVPEREPNDDLAHAQWLAPPLGVAAAIGPARLVKGKTVGDVDVYAFTGGQHRDPVDGGAVFDEARIELHSTAAARFALETLDAAGKRLAAAMTAEDRPAVVPNLAVESGRTYYVRVRGAAAEHAAEATQGSYELLIRLEPAAPGAEREPNDDAAHATNVMDPGVVTTGYFGRHHDEDWLRISPRPELPAAAGRPSGPSGCLRLELGPVERVAPEVRVLGADETLLAMGRGARGDELRMRNVGVPGAARGFLVALRAAEGENVDARWTLRMGVEACLAGAEIEPNDTLGQATQLELAGGSVEIAGFLWPGDMDIYRLRAPPGTLVAVELEGVPGVDLKLARLGRELIRGAPRALVRADEGKRGEGEALPPWPLSPGDEAIFAVSGRPRDVAFDAPYRLTMRRAADDDGTLEREPNDEPATATPWKEGAPAMHGYLAPRGDRDFFRFVAPPGGARATVTIDAGGGTETRAELADDHGRPIDAAAAIVPGRTYLVLVRSASAHAPSARAPYAVTLRFE